MKDFKSLPKMKTGGRVKKYETGGEVKGGYSFDKSDPPWGAKTPIGATHAANAWDKNWLKNEPKEVTLKRIEDARDEADAEVSRESNRGIKPENRKKGGRVTKKVGTVKKNK
jgi:hypothetical protein